VDEVAEKDAETVFEIEMEMKGKFCINSEKDTHRVEMPGI
jgi:hypothetical protein